MKKYLYSALAACSLLTLGACSADEPVNDGTNGEVVNFTIKMADVPTTRMFGNGTEATQLTYAIYEEGETNPFIHNVIDNAFDENLQRELSLRLVAGKTYQMVFWAQNPNCTAYTFNPSDKTITIDYNAAPAANATGNTRDAFFANRSITVSASGQDIPETIVLTRPFAQINIGTSDLNEPAVANLKNIQTSLKCKAFTVLNLLTGDAENETTVETPFANRPNPTTEMFPIRQDNNNNTINYLSCDYILRNGEENLDMAITFRDKSGTTLNTITIDQVPTQRNFRTNIWGALLTSGYNFIIEINPDFEDGYSVHYGN